MLVLFPAWTQLGEWLIADLHGVGPEVTRVAKLSLAIFSAYPLIDTIVSTLELHTVYLPC